MYKKRIPPTPAGYIRQWLIWTQIALQIIFPFFTVFPASAGEVKDDGQEYASLSDNINQVASTLAANNLQQSLSQAKGNLVSGVTSSASSSAQAWLSQFGTAKVQLNVDQDGNWDQSSLDLLVPLYDDKKSMLFSQFGLRKPDDRLTTNLGMGVRTFYLDNWMLGGNAFFDDDMTGKNRRVGFGAEAWTNFLKLSANGYLGTTQWHSSRDFDDYNEKPADGFDIRAEAYLPALPQLGAKVIYEKYYGDKVALFDKDDLQKNPSAVTLGVNYTPVPLITVGTNYRRGQDDMNDMQFQVDMRFDFGHDWRYQLSPDNVALQRSLAGSRYDVVERNNQIVMQYQKKETQGVTTLLLTALTDYSPADGLAQNTLQVQALDAKGDKVKGAPVAWSASGNAKLDRTAGSTDAEGMMTINISDAQNEIVNVTATSGSASTTLPSHFNEVKAAKLVLTVDKNGSFANGQATDDATVRVSDINNHPVANAKVAWALEAPAKIAESQAVTDAEGLAHVKATSLVPGESALSVSSGDLSDQKALQFVVNAEQAKITDFSVTVNNSPANGKTQNSALITVKDPSGNPVKDQPVTVKADKSTVAFGAPAKARAATPGQTDDKGELRVSFSDTVAENVQLTATLSNGDSKQTQATFVADSESAMLHDLKVTKDGALANGTDADHAEVTVLDGQGNPLANQLVTWSATPQGTTFLPASTSTTDSAGKAQIGYTSKIAQTIQLTATLANGEKASTASLFVPDANSEQIKTYTVTGGAVANGTATNSATVIVTDSFNNPVASEKVTWTLSGTAVGSAPESTTDAAGKASITLTDTKAETVGVKVALKNGATETQDSVFVADSEHALITSLQVTKDGSPADNKTPDTAKIVVMDSHNNPVKDAVVTWTFDSASVTAPATSKTNKDGEASVDYTDAIAESVNLTATLANGEHKSVASQFVADVASAKVTLAMLKDGQLADGQKADVVKAVVTDALGHTLANQTITWSTSTTTASVEPTSQTNITGESQVNVTDTVGEAVNITATLANQATASQAVSFTSHSVTAIQQYRSPQKADGSGQIYFTATVTNEKGAPVQNSPVTFSTTGHGVLSATTVNTDGNGEAEVTETDVTPEVVTVTAKSADYTLDAGKSTTGEFTQDQITALTANGKSFAPDAGFPKTGFLSGSFTLEIGNTTANNANYTYTSDNSWLRPDSTPGKYVMVSPPTVDMKTVTLTATPKSGQGQPLTYVVHLDHWFTNIARSSKDPTVADQDCLNKGMTIPGYKLLSDVPPSSMGVRAVGSLWGEWGDLSTYSNWSTASTAQSMWAAEDGVHETRIFVHWRDGYVNENIPSDNMDEVCLTF
ncbi:Ig-like domain-containing protein [Lelliottia wanjuensis]|uniref:Ig-like domain-containing protein n=1 Tax=Lelliottia wanjuensis TaxID=3050585 RepID=UPI00254BF773|nr:Ig-like domain-containing protein [Lelliottia sp. V104_15]MDK9605328.1 Ig-like domain-containing protein [Lelliottia sp. V104_15]